MDAFAKKLLKNCPAAGKLFRSLCGAPGMATFCLTLKVFKLRKNGMGRE